MTEKKKKDDRFEDQLARLEEIVDRLEDESVGLEEALGLFENGMELARQCRARLEEVELRVTQLLDAEIGENEVEDEESEGPLNHCSLANERPLKNLSRICFHPLASGRFDSGKRWRTRSSQAARGSGRCLPGSPTGLPAAIRPRSPTRHAVWS